MLSGQPTDQGKLSTFMDDAINMAQGTRRRRLVEGAIWLLWLEESLLNEQRKLSLQQEKLHEKKKKDLLIWLRREIFERLRLGTEIEVKTKGNRGRDGLPRLVRWRRNRPPGTRILSHQPRPRLRRSSLRERK